MSDCTCDVIGSKCPKHWVDKWGSEQISPAPTLPTVTLHPYEQARELIYSQAWKDAKWPEGEARLIAALLAKARLAEAEWWKLQIESCIHGINFYQHMNFDVADKIELERIASLRQAAGEETK